MCVNRGANGYDTAMELQILKELDHQPDILVFQWYINDIQEDCKALGYPLADIDLYAGLVSPVAWIVKRSYLSNYLYFKFADLSDQVDYLSYLKACSDDEAVWRRQVGYFREILNWSKVNDTRLMVLVFPALEDLNSTRFLTDRISAELQHLGIPHIDIAAKYQGKPIEKGFVVHPQDGHPGWYLSTWISYDILDLMTGKGWIEP